MINFPRFAANFAVVNTLINKKMEVSFKLNVFRHYFTTPVYLGFLMVNFTCARPKLTLHRSLAKL